MSYSLFVMSYFLLTHCSIAKTLLIGGALLWCTYNVPFFTQLFQNVTYHGIYFYSKCQIAMKPILKLTSYLTSQLTTHYVIPKPSYMMNPLYDNVYLVVYLSTCPTEIQVVYWLDAPIGDVFEQPVIKNLGKSNVRFLNMEVNIFSNSKNTETTEEVVETHRIVLHNDTRTFYLVGNLFTFEFFVGFIKEEMNPELVLTNDTSMCVRFIDDAVVEHELMLYKASDENKRHGILLDVNSYSIV
jgi:hypothetical protein